MTKVVINLPHETLRLLRQMASVETVPLDRIVRRFIAEALERRCLPTGPSPTAPAPVPTDRAAVAHGARPSARRMPRLCTPPSVPGGRRV